MRPGKADLRRAAEILGLDPSSSLGDVKTAFRRAALESHPDRGGDAAEFRRLLGAYEILVASAEAPPRLRAAAYPEEPPPGFPRPGDPPGKFWEFFLTTIPRGVWPMEIKGTAGVAIYRVEPGEVPLVEVASATFYRRASYRVILPLGAPPSPPKELIVEPLNGARFRCPAQRFAFAVEMEVARWARPREKPEPQGERPPLFSSS